ncbi:hypothetical protein BD626DRAFT_573138 [Schizophyllum amplum]|uniref:Uncharacterized protein n=1 Tax=Schizophyllum amplum TaxID=97359 RepID=A0A550C2D0_9AGAR|nr:hypothetical protein BD626DRAFT_573138 [Auriculariopsis ampla]
MFQLACASCSRVLIVQASQISSGPSVFLSLTVHISLLYLVPVLQQIFVLATALTVYAALA